jgi:hypothetical protein
MLTRWRAAREHGKKAMDVMARPWHRRWLDGLIGMTG